MYGKTAPGEADRKAAHLWLDQLLQRPWQPIACSVSPLIECISGSCSTTLIYICSTTLIWSLNQSSSPPPPQPVPWVFQNPTCFLPTDIFGSKASIVSLWRNCMCPARIAHMLLARLPCSCSSPCATPQGIRCSSINCATRKTTSR